MSLIFATQLTAVATAVLAVFAVATAYYARRAFLKQSQEVSAIERQVSDQEKLTQQQAELLKVQSDQLQLQRQQLEDQRRERRRAQASRVLLSAMPYTEPGTSKPADLISVVTVRIENTGDQPIYRLIFLWRDGDGEWNDPIDPPDLVILMPGEPYERNFSISPGLPCMSYLLDTSLIGEAVVFRDAAGAHWRLYSDGRLREEPVPDN